MARPVQPLHSAPKSSARIVLNDGTTSIDCEVQSSSEGGAVLRLHTLAVVPNAFRLSIGETPSRPSWVVWRAGRELTVAFTDGAPVEAAS